MKKTLHLWLLGLAMLVAATAEAQTVYSGLLREGFEAATFPPVDWERINVAGSNQWSRSTAQAHSGSASALINYQTTTGEDWLVMPQFAITGTDSLSFWIRLPFVGYPPDSLSIKLSTTDKQLSSFTKTLLHLREGVNYPPNTTTWYQHKISLAAYAGQNVYIAFKHYNNNGDGMYLDDIQLGTIPPADVRILSVTPNGAVTPTGTVPSVTVNNNGSATQSFPVTLTSTDGYTATVTVTNLAPGATQTITFANWAPAPGTYTLTATANLPGDAQPADNTFTRTIESYHTFPNSGWTSQAASPNERWGHGLAAISTADFSNASLYAISGANGSFAMGNMNQKFDAVAGTWSTVAPIPVSRLQVSAMSLAGKIYVAGGYTSGFSPTDRLDIYDPGTNLWTQGASLPVAVGDYAVGTHGDSLLYLIGGYNGSVDVSNVQVYNVKTNTWSAATAKPGLATAGLRGGIAEGKIVVGGGYNQGMGSNLAQAWLGTIDPANPLQITWTALPDMPYGPSSRLGAGALFERVYFTSGDPTGQGNSALASTYAYNTALNRWEVGPAKPTGVSNISNFTPVLYNGQAYLVSFGGYTGNGVTTANEWLQLGPYCNLTATAAQTAPTCAGTATASATVTPVGARGTLTYAWSTTPAQATPVATALSAGTYTVTVTDAYACTASATVTIAESAFPTPVASADTTVCSGGTILLSVSGSTGSTFTWAGPNGFTASGATATISNATPVNNGTYTITEITADGCSAESNTTVAVLTTNVLNGSYTLDPALPASTTNFTSLQSLAAVLNGCGITGPVTVELALNSGPYTNGLYLSQIPGASATNTLTINGNGNELSVCSNSALTRDVIRLDGTDHITIMNFTLNATCSYGWGVHLMGNVSNIMLMDNTINLSPALSQYIGNMAGIVAANSFTNPAVPAGSINGLTIVGNTINNGYHGIRVNGASTTNLATGVNISDNKVNNATQFGIYLTNALSPVLSLNTVDMNTIRFDRSNGIWISQVEDGIIVTRNRVLNAGAMGLYLNRVNTTSTTRGLVANNMLGGGFRYSGLSYALSVNYSNNLDVYYNSTNLDAGVGASASFSGTGHNVVNNSFAYTGGGAGYAMAGVSTSFQTADFNNYYSNGGKFVFFGMDRATLQDLRDAAGPADHDLNSMAENPMYQSATDLHLTFGSPLIGQGTVVSVTEDFDDNSRTSPTDIGADEFFMGVRLAGKNGVAAQVYPNPFRNELTVELTGAAGTVNMVLVDVTGRQVSTQTVAVEEGTTRSNLRVSDALPQGVYLLQVTQGDATGTYRVVKH